MCEWGRYNYNHFTNKCAQSQQVKGLIIDRNTRSDRAGFKPDPLLQSTGSLLDSPALARDPSIPRHSQGAYAALCALDALRPRVLATQVVLSLAE